jgi:outer membrane biogenesis lipoprotein LolB
MYLSKFITIKNLYPMKNTSFLIAILAIFFLSACSDSTCKDPLAINLGIESDCQFSKVAFYITNGQAS